MESIFGPQQKSPKIDNHHGPDDRSRYFRRCSSSSIGYDELLLDRPNRTKPEAVMKSDREIERDVRNELQWDPDLDATDVAVSVKQGVVTLAGLVGSS